MIGRQVAFQPCSRVQSKLQSAIRRSREPSLPACCWEASPTSSAHATPWASCCCCPQLQSLAWPSFSPQPHSSSAAALSASVCPPLCPASTGPQSSSQPPWSEVPMLLQEAGATLVSPPILEKFLLLQPEHCRAKRGHCICLSIIIALCQLMFTADAILREKD